MTQLQRGPRAPDHPPAGAHAAGELVARAGVAADEGGALAHRLVTTMEQVRRAAVRMDRIGAAIETTLARTGGAPGGGPAVSYKQKPA
ncbi:hypothetical protein ACEN88_35105, partial [Massilia sp. CT11-108]|uniref:hypothetical protein n=1 Tax=Massilia sp. CT11-108 TaxID=3393900 RepID=UPI0039A5D0C7